MSKRKYFLLLDSETANTIIDAFVYDCGFAIVDRKGRIYEKHAYIVYDIYRLERGLMETCYYSKKLPKYEQRIKNKEFKIVTLATLRRIVYQTMKKYETNTVVAYNASFDRDALNTTLRYVTKSRYRWFFPYGTKFICIWHMACQVICCQPTYQKWARKHGYISKSGNIKTDAETVYRYYHDVDFIESHMAIDDVEIETFIFAKCIAQHKSMKKYPYRLCWRIPNTKAYKEQFNDAA